MEISLESLQVSVGGRTQIRGVDLEIGSGHAQVILGASGAGKSLLLKCINGLVRPSAGRVLVGGERVDQMAESRLGALRRQVGYVFQYSALFDSMSVFDNLIWAPREHLRLPASELRELAERSLVRVGLSELIPRMCDVMPVSLSGGMAKRVALARALALEPDVLLHDEPTSGLDPASTTAIGDLVRELNREGGITTVVVTHDVELACRIGDHISILGDGELVFQGTPGQLKAARDRPEVRCYLEGKSYSEGGESS